MTIGTGDDGDRWSDNIPIWRRRNKKKRKQWTFLLVTGQKVGGGEVPEVSVRAYISTEYEIVCTRSNYKKKKKQEKKKDDVYFVWAALVWCGCGGGERIEHNAGHS